MTRKAVRAALGVLLTIAALAYLRDPPWLASVTAGLHGWETGTDGRPFRWASGHASFFVPSDRAAIAIPLRAPIATSEQWPVVATIAIDDRQVDQVVLDTPGWRLVTLRLPGGATRRARRIDIRVNRTDDDNRALQVGEVVLR